MRARRQVAALGLGRFGASVARELTRLGHDVLAMDANEKLAQDISDEIAHAVQVDITDGDSLRELGLQNLDAAIVAVSSDLEVSVLATVLLRQLGVKRVVAKAANDLHGSILAQVGAQRVFYPERETGIRVAHSFAAPGVRDYLDVAPGYGIARVPVAAPFSSRSLADVDLTGEYRVTVLALHREGNVTLHPHASEMLHLGDELIVAGLDEDLEKLPGTGALPPS